MDDLPSAAQGRCPKCGSKFPFLYAEACQNTGNHYAYHAAYVAHPFHKDTP